jgi:hypothetical protein
VSCAPDWRSWLFVNHPTRQRLSADIDVGAGCRQQSYSIVFSLSGTNEAVDVGPSWSSSAPPEAMHHVGVTSTMMSPTRLGILPATCVAGF